MLQAQQPSAAYQYPSRLATAADISPELFPRILKYVGTEDNGRGYAWSWLNGLQDLATCSLVCIDWANRCWPRIFREIAAVTSMERMNTLNFYAKHGSPRLIPLADVMRHWRLEQTWASQSWCHLRYNSSFCIENLEDPSLPSLILDGPVPYGLPVSALHSPHWSLPRSMPRCYTSFTYLMLYNIHFPCLSSFAKLLRHFISLEHLRCCKITWAKDDASSVRPIARIKHTTFSMDTDKCTNNNRLCFLAQEIFGYTCSFGRLQAQERDICFNLLNPVPFNGTLDDLNLPRVEEAEASRLRSQEARMDSPSDMSFNFEHTLDNKNDEILRLKMRALTTNVAPPRPLSVTTLCLDVRTSSRMAFDNFRLPYLKACAEKMLSLRLLTLFFKEYSDMEYVTDTDPSLRTPLAIAGRAEITYCFLCPHQNNDLFSHIPPVYGVDDTLVEINPISLLPTGQTWDGHWLSKKRVLWQMVRKYHPHVLPAP